MGNRLECFTVAYPTRGILDIQGSHNDLNTWNHIYKMVVGSNERIARKPDDEKRSEKI